MITRGKTFDSALLLAKTAVNFDFGNLVLKMQSTTPFSRHRRGQKASIFDNVDLGS